MKKILALILMLAMTLFCAAEEISVEERAVPLYEMLLGSWLFESFEEAPPVELASHAVARYREMFATASEAMTDEEIYALLFVSGEYEPLEEAEAYGYDTVRVTVESAVESGIGTLIVSVRSERDYGCGFEFDMYADFHILPDADAPFGARIARVFIPE